MLITFEDMLKHYSNVFHKALNDFIEYLNSEIDAYEDNTIVEKSDKNSNEK